MKKQVLFLMVAFMTSPVFAKTAVECRNELAQTHSAISKSSATQIFQIATSSGNIAQKKKLTSAILNSEQCVKVIAATNGQTVEGIADGLINETLALPAGTLTVELVDTLVGMLIIEN